MANVIDFDELLENSKQNRLKDERELKIFSQYQKVFDESNLNWTPDGMYNDIFLRYNENYINDLLRARGYVFLNDVYEVLGLSKTVEGQVVGWIHNPNVRGQIQFEIWCNTEQHYIVIDFNVEGFIFDKVF